MPQERFIKARSLAAKPRFAAESFDEEVLALARRAMSVRVLAFARVARNILEKGIRDSPVNLALHFPNLFSCEGDPPHAMIPDRSPADT